MAAARVLIIEDDADINTIVATHLTRGGYTCAQAFSGTEAKLLLLGERSPKIAKEDTTPEAPSTSARTPLPFDLIICDLMLPGLTGEELVALIRERDPLIPIVVTSARTAATDKIDLLKLGADDYLAKPFDLNELSARIEVQLRHRARRQTGPQTGSSNVADAHDNPFRSPALAFRAWQLDPDARTFSAAGMPVDLTRIEFNIVETLMRHPRRVWSKQDLFEQAWGEPYMGDDNTVTVHVSKIRAKLKNSGTGDYIKTVWGMGFKLVEE